ncbi:N-acetyltransferase [Hwanghaeella grinnelliae]|uniref:N-acetyltransferase n=2 Tax=Hwanghaeella grinnelliae TaxID=2500179 RepID=A0A3S2ZD42_9PROT|nr:N-acetyltransferase [Hwanghaeella grinnelliae]
MKANKGDTAKTDIRKAFETGPPPGLIAYDGADPVAWCSIAPRDVFIRLGASKVLSPVDERPVWSVSCFFIKKCYRGDGLAQRLLEAADDFVRSQGGNMVEGYPIDPVKKPYPTAYAWTGFAGSFRNAGFQEVARRSETRPIMRRQLD